MPLNRGDPHFMVIGRIHTQIATRNVIMTFFKNPPTQLKKCHVWQDEILTILTILNFFTSTFCFLNTLPFSLYYDAEPNLQFFKTQGKSRK